MGKNLLKAEFERFFVLVSEHTDLLLKIFESQQVVVPPEKKKEILTEILLSEKKQIRFADYPNAFLKAADEMAIFLGVS